MGFQPQAHGGRPDNFRYIETLQRVCLRRTPGTRNGVHDFYDCEPIAESLSSGQHDGGDLDGGQDLFV